MQMKSLLLIVTWSVNVSFAQIATLNSAQKTGEEFLAEPTISRLMKECRNFELQTGFHVSCADEIVLYQYARTAHAHGVLLIIRFDSLSLEIFRENLSSHIPSYQGKIVNLDSSDQAYKELVGLVKSTRKNFVQQVEIDKNKKSSSRPFIESVYLYRSCEENKSGLAAFVPTVYKEGEDDYPDSNLKKLINFIETRINQTYLMINEIGDR